MTTYFSVGSIQRSSFASPKDIGIEAFTTLKIDYRSCGTRHDQFVQLNRDFDHLSAKAVFSGINGAHAEVCEAFHHYVQLIKCGYIE